jgi:hypothetical protein
MGSYASSLSKYQTASEGTVQTQSNANQNKTMKPATTIDFSDVTKKYGNDFKEIPCVEDLYAESCEEDCFLVPNIERLRHHGYSRVVFNDGTIAYKKDNKVVKIFPLSKMDEFTAIDTTGA